MTANRITDFTVWDLRQEFKSEEAAYLWLGLEPNYGNDHSASMVSMRAALEEAAQRGEFDARNDSGRHIARDKLGRERGIYVALPTYYSRNALRQWAERKGQYPPFLFPEYRQAKPETENAPLDDPPEKTPDSELSNNREKGSVKKLLAALLSLNYGHMNWQKLDAESLADEIIDDLSGKGIEQPMERRTLVKWLTKVGRSGCQ